MKASFPFPSFQVKEYFTLSVQIAPPLGVTWILEMFPSVIMYFLEPFPALHRPCKLISLKKRYQRLHVYPPELLIPLQLLRRVPFPIHKIEYAPILLIPTVIDGLQGSSDRFVDQFRPFKSDRQIHDEPHGLYTVSRVY